MNKTFTTDIYENILVAATSRYEFITPGDEFNKGNVIWRHDIDFSPQRALALAKIEATHGVSCSYFFQVTSLFYNVLEPEVEKIIKEIVLLGHSIGIHYEQRPEDNRNRLIAEARILSELTETDIRMFSLHNPTTFKSTEFNADTAFGMINASSIVDKKGVEYCSDSNGLWRFKTLWDVINEPVKQRLYVLTHPEWWQSINMLPRDRIQRCIDGRAVACGEYYDKLLSDNGRPNLGKNI